jgi:hypothetical protein
MTTRRRRYQTDAHGKRTAVVVPIAEFEQMLEDLHDLAVIADRRNEPTMTFDELKHRLAEGGEV